MNFRRFVYRKYEMDTSMAKAIDTTMGEPDNVTRSNAVDGIRRYVVL